LNRFELPATATLAHASELLRGLAGEATEIDAAALQDFDTSAVALLLEARRRAEARGARLVVRDPPAKLIELARLYGVDELLSLPPT
jgi:phospholipid transport system transporter-binding protein